MKTFVVTLTLGVLFGSPAFSLPTNGDSSIDAARVEALQQCSAIEKNIRNTRGVPHSLTFTEPAWSSGTSRNSVKVSRLIAPCAATVVGLTFTKTL